MTRNRMKSMSSSSMLSSNIKHSKDYDSSSDLDLLNSSSDESSNVFDFMKSELTKKKEAKFKAAKMD